MSQPEPHAQHQSWEYFCVPLAFALMGAALYAWGLFGLDNTPPPWADYIGSHRWGEATFAYLAARAAFAGAILTGIPCAILFLIDRARERADQSMKPRG